jgi:hypothetical protein
MIHRMLTRPLYYKGRHLYKSFTPGANFLLFRVPGAFLDRPKCKKKREKSAATPGCGFWHDKATFYLEIA